MEIYIWHHIKTKNLRAYEGLLSNQLTQMISTQMLNKLTDSKMTKQMVVGIPQGYSAITWH